MEVNQKSARKISPKSWREIIVSRWRELGSPPVGSSELAHIHSALADDVGQDQVPSPAQIARELAQEGAQLRHPEIIESDARWRESQIAGQINAFQSLRRLQTGAPLQFDQAAAIFAELEKLRVRFVSASDEGALVDLKTFALEARQAAKNRAKDPSLPATRREVHTEISEWFRVWLETPKLFDQWLELRKSSAVFKEKFLNYE